MNTSENRIFHPAALAVLALPALLSCAHQYNLPANKFESPEVSGRRYKPQIELPVLQTGPQLLIKPNASASAAENSTPKLTSFALNYALGFAAGLDERVDAGARIQPNGPVAFRGRYQFYGNPSATADPGNIAAALSAGSGISMVADTVGANDSRMDTTAFYYKFDVGLSAGGRISRKLLIYLGGSFDYYGYGGSIKPLSGPGASFSGSAMQLALHGGLRFNYDAFFLHLEASKASTTSGKINNLMYYPGVVAGMQF
ncbi:MAG: hypothetical protein A2583_03565 [Bdellovibrionales bacterium RIFOXYD1_FULL_53_11]|nr:MAG: hypothetical protein A2583_03565 [Bdellovibrionales bacterium RIFOXYD1_FULL_53_11]